MKKTCKECGHRKILDDFGIDRTMKDGRRSKCRKCLKEHNSKYFAELSEEEKEKRRERTRQWKKDNPEAYRLAWQKSFRKMRYGITDEQYQEMLNRQNGVCALCKRAETQVQNGRTIPLAVDHDNKTGQVRELLCSIHNRGLGCFQHNPELLEAAAIYLRKHQR